MGYPIRAQLQTGFKNLGNLALQQTEYNTKMSALRITVECFFGDIANFFALLDLKKKHKAAATLSIKPCYRNTIFSTTKNINASVFKFDTSPL